LMQGADTQALRAKATIVARFGAEAIEIVAPNGVTALSALEGASVDVGPEGSPQALTLATLFDRLSLHPKLVHHSLDQALALLHAGKLGAVAAMGEPTPSLLGDFGAKGGFHLLPVAWSPGLRALFIPAVESDKDRPHLVEAGATLATVGAPIALLAFESADKTRESDNAVNALYESFSGGAAPWNGAAWKNVNFACATPNWPRAKATDDWLAKRGAGPDPALVDFQSSVADTAGDVDKVYDSLMRWRSAVP
jgi:hypothetical protein